MKRIVFLMLALVLALSACTDGTSTKLENEAKSKKIHVEENLLESEGPFYKSIAAELPDNVSLVRFAVKTRDLMYFCALDKQGDDIFFKYDLTESLYTQLDVDIPGNIYSIDVSDNCLYILVNRNDIEGNNSFEFKEYDLVTQNIRTIQLDNIISKKDGMEIAGFSVAGGCFYVNAFNSIYCLDDIGKFVADFKTEDTWRGVFNSDFGDSLKMYNFANNSFVVQELDLELRPMREYILSTKYNGVFQGLSHNQIFVTDENYIYSLDLENGDKKPYASIPLFNLNTSNFIPLSNESFFTIQNGVPTFWTAAAENDTGGIAILKCAAYNASFELQLAVSLFNYNHNDIKIDIVDYSIYNDGLNKLMVEITAGTIPDIFELSGLPMTALKSSGLLLNLEAYLSDKNIFPNILEILKKDEGVFELVPGFQIAAMAGNSKYITTPSLNVDVLLNLTEKARSEGKYLFPKYLTRETFISFILSFSGDSFVDIEKGFCNFEDEKIASLIRFALELPSQDELDNQAYTEAVVEEFNSVLNDKQLFSMVETGNPVLELLKLKGLYRADVEFVGFPTNSGNGIAMTPFLRLALSSSSQYKDETKAFFDYLLSNEFQTEMSRVNYMPVISEYLSRYINNIIAGYKEKPLKIGIANVVLECPLVDDDTAKDVWDLIGRIDCVNEYDTNIYKIVLDECQPFFAGQKDVSEVMSIIQNRVSIYISEKQ